MGKSAVNTLFRIDNFLKTCLLQLQLTPNSDYITHHPWKH